MSHRENAGLNCGDAPGFSVVADDPLKVPPTCCVSGTPVSCGRGGFTPRFASIRVGVFHNAANTCLGSWSIRERPSGRVVAIPGVSFQSRAEAVTQSAGCRNAPETITSMRRVDGTSWKYVCIEGVTRAFQVSTHSVEPILASRCINFLEKEDAGTVRIDESKVVGPQMPAITGAELFACRAEWLAWWAPGEDGLVVWPSCESEGEGPAGKPCEPMMLGVATNVLRLYVGDAA